MTNRPNAPSWKVLAMTLATTALTSLAQLLAQPEIDLRAVLQAIVAGLLVGLSTFGVGYQVIERNPSRSAIERAATPRRT